MSVKLNKNILFRFFLSMDDNSFINNLFINIHQILPSFHFLPSALPLLIFCAPAIASRKTRAPLMITEILNYSISFLFIFIRRFALRLPFLLLYLPPSNPNEQKHAGNRATTVSKVAVWKWIYIYHMVSLGSDKFGEYWAGEAVLILVSGIIFCYLRSVLKSHGRVQCVNYVILL